MAKYAVMPIADYEDACNAVREKTGGTESIVSGDLGEQIRSIAGGEDLSEELTAQDSLIDQIMAELATCTITIKAGGMPTEGPFELAYVGINGTTYYQEYNGEDIVVKVAPGTDIYFDVSFNNSEASNGCWISIDEEPVVDGPGGYAYEVTTDMEILLGVNEAKLGAYYGVIHATTSESTFTPTDSGGTTYKSKIADNNADLQIVLNKVEEAVNAVKTCTVVYDEPGIGLYVIYTAYKNEAYETKIVNVRSGNGGVYTFENVAYGSLFLLFGGEEVGEHYVSITGGAEFVPNVLSDDFVAALRDWSQGTQPGDAIKITGDATITWI